MQVLKQKLSEPNSIVRASLENGRHQILDKNKKEPQLFFSFFRQSGHKPYISTWLEEVIKPVCLSASVLM